MQAHFQFSASGAAFGKLHRNMTKSAKPCRKCGLYLWEDAKMRQVLDFDFVQNASCIRDENLVSLY